MHLATSQPDPGLARPDVSVVVLTYNEAASLANTVEEIHGELGPSATTYEVVIVDDGSGDESGIIADRLAEEHASVRVIHHEVNAGLGAGYRTAFAHSHGRYVTFCPADGQFPPSIVGEFISQIADYDLFLGYLPQNQSTATGRILSVAERVLYRVLFGALPRFGGVFMVRRQLLDEIPLESTGRGWAIVMELIVKASRGGYRIRSHPTTAYRPRQHGTSKVNNLRTIWSNLTQVLELWNRMRHSRTSEIRADPNRRP